jgi:hypothetical protein
MIDYSNDIKSKLWSDSYKEINFTCNTLHKNWQEDCFSLHLLKHNALFYQISIFPPTQHSNSQFRFTLQHVPHCTGSHCAIYRTSLIYLSSGTIIVGRFRFTVIAMNSQTCACTEANHQIVTWCFLDIDFKLLPLIWEYFSRTINIFKLNVIIN